MDRFGYVGAFMRASNVIYEVEEGRGIIKLRPLQMLVTLVLVVLLAIVVAAVALTGPVAKEVGSRSASAPPPSRSGTSPNGRCWGCSSSSCSPCCTTRPERQAAGVQVDHARQPAGHRGLAGRLGRVRPLRRQLRLLQQDLRYPRRA